MSNQQSYMRFREMLEGRQRVHDPDLDIRQHVLKLARGTAGFGYVSENLSRLFGANLTNVFTKAVGVDQPGITDCDGYFALGTIYDDPAKSHQGAVKLFQAAGSRDVVLFEAGFLATTHSWAHSFRTGDPAQACLGYVYDDIAHYFMADYPNRLIHKLNSPEVPSTKEIARAKVLIARIVAQRISKYNAQPMDAPAMTEDYSRRVLVCDQAYADASTVYGKVGEAEFEQMLLAAITENPDAEILVKTHPDSVWEKDKRTGYYAHLQSTGRVRMLRDPVNPYTLFDLVDTVYVGTSQMGLEALFAGKKVVTFGAPFYAGWGMTDDRQKIAHRHRRRSLAEVFHYFYVWYTIYHLPGRKGVAQIEDVLTYIETHRPYPLPPTDAELAAPPRVSVVIPVHGVEKYIEECLSSVQRQTLREIEIIPVNDASPDGSQAIIDRLAAGDPRIRPIVLSENIGQGFARNKGLAAARGDYIWFIDSDDWLVDPDFLEKTVAAADANRADMTRAKKAGEAIFDADDRLLRVEEDRTETHFTRDVASTTYAQSPDILHSRHFCLWLYRRDFIEQNDIRFVTTQWEERAFLLKAYLHARTITLTTNRCFMYRIRGASTARRDKTMQDVERFLQNFEQICQLMLEAGGADRASDLRVHLNFQISQFLHFMFMGFWYRTLTADEAPDGPMLQRVAAALSSVDFRPGDLTLAPMTVRNELFHQHVYHLLTAALLAHRFDWIDVALGQDAVAQQTLYDEFLRLPASPAEIDFQAALNTYARNGKVRTGAIPAGRDVGVDRPRPRVVIHIGATKTGSTFIQHMLDRNRPALLRAGIWCPEIGMFWQQNRPHKQAGHADFIRAATRDDAVLRDHLDRGLALMGDRVHTIVLSSEAYFLNDNAHRIADYLAGHPVEMVVYLRRQDEWANSQYCEFVAGGAVGRVDVPVEEWLSQPVTRRRLDYRNPLHAWAGRIGRENVHARVFDKARLKNGDLLADFAEAAGLPQLLDLPRPEGAEANEARLSSAQVALLRLFNARPFASRDAYFAFIEEVGTALTGWRTTHGVAIPRPWVLTEAQADALMADQAAGNARIARDFFGLHDQPLFGPRAPMPSPDSLHPEEIGLVEAIYARHAPAPDQPAARVAAVPSPAPAGAALGQPAPPLPVEHQPRIVNYGLFGWRLWLLTPLLAAFYARVAPTGRLAEFLTEPADFAALHWGRRRPLVASLLYPQGNPMGPFGVFRLWMPVAQRMIAATGRQDMREAFVAQPLVFARRMRSRMRRLVGRLMFPIGELR